MGPRNLQTSITYHSISLQWPQSSVPGIACVLTEHNLHLVYVMALINSRLNYSQADLTVN